MRFKFNLMIKKTLPLLFFLVLGYLDQAQNSFSGKVLDENKEAVIGASVLIKDTRNGTSTDLDGNFHLSTSKAYPVTVVVSFIGYATQQIPVNNANPITVRLEPDTEILSEVNVVERRLSDKQKESALTVEAMDIMAIKETPAVNFYEGLSNLKGVDMTSASISFKIINTRGFNSTSPVRSLQIIDRVDNQAPGLNFSLGNFLGASELDVMNVDVIAGASTAFYGPNAFNGVISMTTKDPFTFKGLSASVKAGERNLTEVAVRWADVIKNKNGEDKFAYKINLFWLKANDWEATNLNSVDESNLTDTPTSADNPGGYDAVNRYGDEQPFDDGGVPKLYPGMGTFHRAGIEERYIVDYNTENLKIATSLHYRFKPDVELIYAFNYGTGTTVYQGDNRFSLKGIKFFQNRIELQKKDKWFIRAYATNEDAGQSYDAYFTALRMQERVVTDQFFGLNYRTLWQYDFFNNRSYGDSTLAHPDFNPAWNGLNNNDFRDSLYQLALNNPEEFSRWHRNNNIATNNWFGGGDSLIPGTAAFDALKQDIISKTAAEGGSRLYDKSALYHVHGEYKFDPQFIGQFTVGGNARMYTPSSNGTIFSDTNGIQITNREFGVYGGWERFFINDRLKLNATLRIDKNENFDYLPTFGVSAVYNVDDINTLRLSFSSAIRNPTLQDQYLYYNTGRAILVGNLSGFDSLVQVDRIGDFLAAPPDERANFNWSFFDLDPIKPEQATTAELGYRTTLWRRLYVDANYYYTWYNNFIGYNIAGTGVDPTQLINPFNDLEILRIASNAKEQVTTQGFSLGLNYYFAKYYMVSGNYTWTVLNTGADDPIVPAYNTPEHKFNVSFGGRDMKLKPDGSLLWGFNVTYKWIEGFRFEGSPQFTGLINTYDLLDVQLNMSIKNWNTTVKLGASNALNNKVYQVYGGPQVGRLAYVSIVYDWIKK